jgi:hypothetical protein
MGGRSAGLSQQMKQPKCRLCGAHHYSYQPHSVEAKPNGTSDNTAQLRPDDDRDDSVRPSGDVPVRGLEEQSHASARNEFPNVPSETAADVDGLHTAIRDTHDDGNGDRIHGNVSDLSLEAQEIYRRVRNARMRPYMRKWRARRKQQKSGDILIKDPE